MDIVQLCRNLFWKFFYGEISYEELQEKLDELKEKQIKLFKIKEVSECPH